MVIGKILAVYNTSFDLRVYKVRKMDTGKFSNFIQFKWKISLELSK